MHRTTIVRQSSFWRNEMPWTLSASRNLFPAGSKSLLSHLSIYPSITHPASQPAIQSSMRALSLPIPAVSRCKEDSPSHRNRNVPNPTLLVNGPRWANDALPNVFLLPSSTTYYTARSCRAHSLHKDTWQPVVSVVVHSLDPAA